MVSGKSGNSAQQMAAETNADGDIVVHAESLSADTVTFIRAGDDSKIELIARKGVDGTAKVALGTCQSCNGAPGAYYTQDGDVLKCNNCGLTFPLDVIDAPGGGCHPIMLNEPAPDPVHADCFGNPDLCDGAAHG